MPSHRTKKTRVEITFAETNEILDIRAGFFKGAYNHPTLNSAKSVEGAIAKVQEWRHRGPIPHAMKSTMELADAVVCDDTNNKTSVAMYAQALANFVTGYTDSQQNLKRKISMFEVGRSIGLPAAYVTIRHSIVHGEMPSLIELRRCTLGALKWLWEDYWCHFDGLGDPRVLNESSISYSEDQNTSHEDTTQAEDSSLMDRIIKLYHDRTNPLNDKQDGCQKDRTFPSTASRNTVEKLGVICDKNEGNVEILVGLLLTEGRMLPRCPKEQTAESIIYQWWPLVEGQSKRTLGFGKRLFILLAKRLSQSSFQEGDHMPHCQAVAIKAWFGFILKQDKYGGISGGLPVRNIVRLCLAVPSPYTISTALETFESKYYEGCAYEKEALLLLQAWVRNNQPTNMPVDPVDHSDLRVAIDQDNEEMVSNVELLPTIIRQKLTPSLLRCPRPIGKEGAEL